MDPLTTSALIGGGASLIGGWMAGKGASSQNKLNAREAFKQRRFQKHMYKNRYRMQMKDMEKAGLNPLLSYSQGPPGAPGGASARMENVGEAAVEGAGKGVSSALAVTAQAMAKKMQKVQIDNISNDTDKKIAEIGLLGKQADNQVQQTATSAASQRRMDIENERLNHLMPGIIHDAEIRNSTLGRGSAWAESLLRPLSHAGAAVGGALIGRGVRAGMKGKRNRANNKTNRNQKPRRNVEYSPARNPTGPIIIGR